MYHINTRNFFKIWFSTDSNCFLGMTNQQRFIRDRLNNPEATFTLIYSSHCLSKESVDKLNIFCKQHDIQAFDFDMHLDPMLSNTQDIQLYHYAKSEIANSIQDTGGNMAAAADCTRVIVPVLAKFGIYSDFDVSVNISMISREFKVKSPVLLNVNVSEESEHNFRLCTYPAAVNNNVLIASYDLNDPTQLSAEATHLIRKVQLKILKGYSHPKETVQAHLSVSGGSELVDKYFLQHPDADIFSLRKYFQDPRICESLRELNAKLASDKNAQFSLLRIPRFLISLFIISQVEPLSHEAVDLITRRQLLFATVLPVSGPNVYYAMYDNETIDQQRVLFRNSSLKENHLGECFLCSIGDRSWTPEGKLKLKNLDQETEHSEITQKSEPPIIFTQNLNSQLPDKKRKDTVGLIDKETAAYQDELKKRRKN